MERSPDPSVLEYILRVKKVEVTNCEAISQALILEEELEEWNAGMESIEGSKGEKEAAKEFDDIKCL